ncbi:efflux RND transporter periplasmic adaptor subunit [Leptotrichia sp. OH3620_COT-345]|nr:efflux RND transporter periplasmic adaptor subunit [Leptotrichia sp. OH3620_COT-345]
MKEIYKYLKGKTIVFLILGVIFLIACGKKKEENVYEVTTVEKGDISLSIEKTGQVVSENEVSVYTTANQRVNKVFFKAGDNVKKGDIVLTFYPVDKNELQRKIQIKSLEVRQKQRDLRNVSELKKIGGASAVSVDDAKIALQTVQLELLSLKEDFALIVDHIKSPVDGVITAMTADENYRVNTETTLFKVSDVKNMKVEVNLSDTQIKDITPGQRVEITSDSLPDGEKIDGVVSQISGVSVKSTNLDESNTTVSIKLNNSGNLRPGTTINATIFYKESKNVLKIPYNSVINENNKFYVFLVGNDNKISKKEVILGNGDDSYYEVVSGISSGEKIIAVIDENLKDGEKIKIADPNKKTNGKGNKKGNSKPNKNNNRDKDSERNPPQ